MIRRAYTSVQGRRVHYRWMGAGKPVILLHASPESSTAMTAQLQSYGADHLAIALDTPGCGCSDPLPVHTPTMFDYAGALASTIDALGLARVALVGRHTGAAIAVEFARRFPDRVSGLVCDGLPIYAADRRADYLANYVEPNPPRWDGSHLLRAWFRFREQHVFWPWFKQSPSSRADMDLPPASRLHQGCLNILMSGDASGKAEQAVFRYDMSTALQHLTVPTLIATREGDSLYKRQAMLKDLPDWIRVAGLDRRSGYLSSAERSALRTDLLAAPQNWPVNAGGHPRLTRGFVEVAGVQIAIRRSAPNGDLPQILVLPDTPFGGELLEQPLEELAESAAILCIDAPGSGDSGAPAGDVSVDIIVEAALAVLEKEAFTPDAIVGIGLGGYAAAKIAQRLPLSAKQSVIQCPTMTADTARAALADPSFFSDLTPDRHGLHLVRAWHQMRDQMLWHPEELGQRRAITDSEIDIKQLQRRVTDLMKHPGTVKPYCMIHAEQVASSAPPALADTGVAPDAIRRFAARVAS